MIDMGYPKTMLKTTKEELCEFETEQTPP